MHQTYTARRLGNTSTLVRKPYPIATLVTNPIR